MFTFQLKSKFVNVSGHKAGSLLRLTDRHNEHKFEHLTHKVAEVFMILIRVRTIPEKLPNTQYYWVILIPIPNTNTDTHCIISLPPCAAALSGLDTVLI